MGREFEDQFELCPICGQQKGVDAGCGDCARQQMEEEGHSGYVDVFGHWICYGACPCEHDNADEN